MLTLLENKRGSLGSVLSGGRSWIAFATMVLGYALEACLPPVHVSHVMMWLQCCRCAGTAQNDASYLRFLCVTFSLSCIWYTEQVRLFLRGLRKRRLAAGMIPQTCKVLLNLKLLKLIVIYFVYSIEGAVRWHPRAGPEATNFACPAG